MSERKYLPTKWTAAVDERKPLPEYPRPSLVRKDWLNLNGLWEYQIIPAKINRLRTNETVSVDTRTFSSQGTICVPFCIESYLSKVQRRITENEKVWYRKIIQLPEGWGSQIKQSKHELLVHFGGVDYETEVYCNSQLVGKHTGGYNPFTFNLSEFLTKKEGLDKGGLNKEGKVKEGTNWDATQPITLDVLVWDPTEKGMQQKGKQISTPSGIFYTSTTGIWKTVWLELIPPIAVAKLNWKNTFDWTTHNVNNSTVNVSSELTIDIDINSQNNKEVSPNIPSEIDCTLRVDIYEPQDPEEFYANPDKSKVIKTINIENIQKNSIPISEIENIQKNSIPISIMSESIHLWSPDHPLLYPIRITLTATKSNTQLDSVLSYTGFRAIEVTKEKVPQILLNKQKIFHLGLLDQGYWPDGIYTAPTEEALRFDIEVSKQLGFNMIRKHIKVEPERWYYHCDRLGMLVWQDMINGGKSGAIHILESWILWSLLHRIKQTRNAESKAQFYEELREMISDLSHFPSIVVWDLFNEGWGQFETKKVTEFARKLDPTRLLNSATGNFDERLGDLIDRHIYMILPQRVPRPRINPKKGGNRASVLGEIGGYGLIIPEHRWPFAKAFKYGKMLTPETYESKYRKLIERILQLKKKGLCGVVYTQTTDVEAEINGVLTYDRVVFKMPPEKFREINSSLI